MKPERWHVYSGQDLCDSQVFQLMKIGFLLVHVPIGSYTETHEYLYDAKHWDPVHGRGIYDWANLGIYLRAKTVEARKWALAHHFVEGVR